MKKLNRSSARVLEHLLLKLIGDKLCRVSILPTKLCLGFAGKGCLRIICLWSWLSIFALRMAQKMIERMCQQRMHEAFMKNCRIRQLPCGKIEMNKIHLLLCKHTQAHVPEDGCALPSEEKIRSLVCGCKNTITPRKLGVARSFITEKVFRRKNVLQWSVWVDQE